MSWRISPSSGRLNFAPATNAWLAAVEAADGQLLENGVYNAMGAFGDYRIPLGGACCLMAGALTLAGALVPMVGAGPTEVNFVSEDYDRTTGLVGDGSTKYLNSNRNNNADGQDSRHIAVYATARNTEDAPRAYIRATFAAAGGTQLISGASAAKLSGRCSDSATATSASSLHATNGLFGASRSTSAQYQIRGSSATEIITQVSSTPGSGNYYVFAGNNLSISATDLYSNARLSYYSIGPAADLEAMDTAITTCMNALAAAGI